MATRRAIELGRRVSECKDALAYAVKPLGDRMLPTWRMVLRLERAAVAVGEHREKMRRAKAEARP